MGWLYLIEILHQTTTLKRFILTLLRCILSKFYIKPQQRRQNRYDKDCCILSKFYIKPQPGLKPHGFAPVVSYRNSTSNHNNVLYNTIRAAVVSYRNSTSNHNVFAASANFTLVVSYRNSTSNHNLATVNAYFNYVVSYRNSTSNHNSSRRIDNPAKLYLIEILHQTTTIEEKSELLSRCILSKFYIKPQQSSLPAKSEKVVSYRNSTSNHNCGWQENGADGVVSYRNSTSNHNVEGGQLFGFGVVSYRNSTSNHNADIADARSRPVVSYRNSTSNHNGKQMLNNQTQLYLIEILHQTTTTSTRFLGSIWLYLIEILHQTTTMASTSLRVSALYLIEILHQTTTPGGPS